MSMNKVQRNRRKRLRLEHWQIIALYLVIYDIVAVNFSYFLGLWLRFDCRYSQIPSEYLVPFIRFMPVYSIFCI